MQIIQEISVAVFNMLIDWRNKMIKNICVYSSSSSILSAEYREAATELGINMAKKKYNLVFGGGTEGLMGYTARAVHKHGGRVIGIIPEYFNVKGVVYEECNELIVTQNMRQRKAIMEEKAHAFIALPGGFGTLEELLEIITLKQVERHNKPVVMINTKNFFTPLLDMFDHIFKEKFAKPEFKNLYYVATDGADAISYIDNYEPGELIKKRFG